jgi:predicted KAP-like P-loop ATPase
MKIERPKIELLTDNSIKTVEQDKFERKGFVNAIAEIIHSQSTKVNASGDADYKKVDENLIIGIFGEWGFGKSSIINMLDENLRERKLLTAYFNPWMYGSEDQIIKSLFNLIIERCGLVPKEKEKLVKLLKRYYPLVAIVSPIAGKAVDASLNIIGKTEETDATVLKGEIDKLLLGTANPLTIYIDDVDRLNKSEVQVLFKTLRLIASFKHVIYVVSCDFEMVARSIKENYSDGQVQDGRSFIDKIIQIPIRIPEIKPELLLNFGLEYIKKTVDIDLTGNELFNKLFQYYLRSPRDIKRFVNSFRFTHNYIGGSFTSSSDLIIIELIKTKAPLQFDFIKLYYESLKSEDPRKLYHIYRREYMKLNNLDFSEGQAKFSQGYIDIEFVIDVFRLLFKISWMDFYFIDKDERSLTNVKNWNNHFEYSKRNTFFNPKVFKQYMELRMNKEDIV